jgi:hypothetical protein
MNHLCRAIALTVALACAPTAWADVVIQNDPGGKIGDYVQKYTDLAYRQERIVISGWCNSACTLLLGIVPVSRVCVRPGASLGFHSASLGQLGPYSEYGTRVMWMFYPKRVRQMIRLRGWDGQTAHPRVISIKASAVYRACPRQN